MSDDKNVRKQFALWTVKDVDYKLRLTTADVQTLEAKYDRPIAQLFLTDGIPPVSIMLTVLHLSMQKFQHGIDRKAVDDIYDDYISEGGNMIDFYTKTYLDIGAVSGFFTDSLVQTLQEDVKKIEE